jgi:hypothetical protein
MTMTMTMRMKDETQQCRHCKLDLPTHKFHRDRKKANGLYPTCRSCRSKYRRLIDISDVEYKKILEAQNNQCAICGTDASEFKFSLNVDHDYKTNKIRGLLCTNCNMGLGHFKDSISNLHRALLYIGRHNA